jgi:hypothetical protein
MLKRVHSIAVSWTAVVAGVGAALLQADKTIAASRMMASQNLRIN